MEIIITINKIKTTYLDNSFFLYIYLIYIYNKQKGIYIDIKIYKAAAQELLGI